MKNRLLYRLFMRIKKFTITFLRKNTITAFTSILLFLISLLNPENLSLAKLRFVLQSNIKDALQERKDRKNNTKEKINNKKQKKTKRKEVKNKKEREEISIKLYTNTKNELEK